MANRQYGCWGYKPKPLVNEGDDLSPLEHDDDRAKQIESALLELVEAKDSSDRATMEWIESTSRGPSTQGPSFDLAVKATERLEEAFSNARKLLDEGGGE